MSKQKITEQELFAKIAKLQEHMDQSVEEGWWGDNMPEFLGGDPAKAPMKLPVTPKNYARVQKMLPAMYAAAKVDPNADEVVKQRFGVYLPPFEKWDGTVPSGRGDFLTRNVFGRDGAAAGEAEGTKAQQAEMERQQRVEANARKLTDLYTKLKELVPAAFEEKAATPPAAVATPVKESLAESMKRLAIMIAEQEQTAAETPTASGETPTAHPAEALIKEINDTIAAIEADDPDEEDLQMISAVKEKVAQCQNIIKQEAATGKKDTVTPADTVNPDEEAKAAEAAKRHTDVVNPDEEAKAAEVAAAYQAATKKPTFPWSQLYDMNKSIIGNNPDLIKPGQKFELPDGKGSYTVVPGDTLSGIAAGQGKGKYETNVPPAPPKIIPKTPAVPFKKELPPEFDTFTNKPKSTTGTYQHLDVSDPKVKAMQDKADKDPNNASFTTTIREDQTLARIISLVNHR